VRLAPGSEAEAARQEALDILTEAEASFGPSPSLDRVRRGYAGARAQVGLDRAAVPAPQTAWEYYNLGRFYLRSGKLELASEQFQLGLELRPQDFWLNFFQGLCAYRIGRHAEAAQSFHICVALSPETAECYYNRAMALEALGHVKEALHNYMRALELKPTLADAAMNRGILLYKNGRLLEATASLEQALRSTSSRILHGEICYDLALVDLARGEKARALDRLKMALEYDHKSARDLYERLQRQR
jgi:tetratricopeptide (TPR) repeat protein